MAIQTAGLRNSLATAYKTAATHAALYTTAPGATAGTEVSGAPYARKPLTWGAPTNGTVTATAVFDVPAGVTIQGGGLHDALTGGTYLDGATVTPQTFATAGTYTLTLSFAQS